MSYTSKYTGNEIDELLDKVNEGVLHEEEVLWEGESGSKTSAEVETDIHLSQSIKDYDRVGFYISYVFQGYLRHVYEEVPVDRLIEYIEGTLTTSGDRIAFVLGYVDNVNFWQVNPGSTDTDLLTLSILSYVTKIIGIKFNKLSAPVDFIPTGNIISFMGTKAPAGYLVCDGAELDISKYSKLAAHFETQFGTKNHFGGDGITTFAVPDLRNEFLRGFGDRTNAIGIHQDATEHLLLGYDVANRDLYIQDLPASTTYLLAEKADKYITETDAKKVLPYFIADGDATGNGMTRYTSRPTNVAVLYCIKY